MATISLGDLRLHCEVSGAGPPLLLVHGFPLDHTMWKYQIAELASARRVIAPDLRGFGKSAVTPGILTPGIVTPGIVTPGIVTMEQFADDLDALLSALGIAEPVTLCGLSMGGYIAFLFMRKYPQRVARLILCDTRAAPDTPEAAEARRKNAQRVLEIGVGELVQTMFGKLFAPETIRERPADVEAVRQVMLASPPQGVAAALLGMAQRPDSTPLLNVIRVPTLVIVGEHDVISPADEMRHIAAAIPQARFSLIPRAGHMAPLEQPEAVNGVIGAFVGKEH
jgi:3-oxoadipate enol-lactonase